LLSGKLRDIYFSANISLAVKEGEMGRACERHGKKGCWGNLKKEEDLEDLGINRENNIRLNPEERF
jgi:hypothetical protein